MGTLAAIKNAMMDEDEQYMVYNRREIAGILRDLAKRRDILSAVFDHGKGMVPTSVVDVDYDGDAVYLDVGPDEIANSRLLSSERTIFITIAGGVKVQWISAKVSSAKLKSGPAFKLSIPEKLQRVQRREYYRLTTPVVNPLVCTIPMAQAEKLELALVDISAGGIGVTLPEPVDARIMSGAEFHNCSIDLPSVGKLELTLRVQGLWTAVLKNNVTSQRAGLAFVNPRPAAQSLIQRYMVKLERERIGSQEH